MIVWLFFPKVRLEGISFSRLLLSVVTSEFPLLLFNMSTVSPIIPSIEPDNTSLTVSVMDDEVVAVEARRRSQVSDQSETLTVTDGKLAAGTYAPDLDISIEVSDPDGMRAARRGLWSRLEVHEPHRSGRRMKRRPVAAIRERVLISAVEVVEHAGTANVCHLDRVDRRELGILGP